MHFACVTGHALMVSAGFLLKKLAHEHNLAVLVRFFLFSFYLNISFITNGRFIFS